MSRCRAYRYEGHQSWDGELHSLSGHRCLLSRDHHSLHMMRCIREGGHVGDCAPGSDPVDLDNLCTLTRRSMDVFESNVTVVTNAENWPELDGQIPINWTAIVDAENDLVCVVPPQAMYSCDDLKDQQAISKRRAQIICDILNAVQSE